MPLRSLLYIAREFEQFFPQEVRYKRGLVSIPTPAFFTFYNGEEKQPKERIMRLSDAFVESGGTKPPLELIVKVININKEQGHYILDECKPLREYSDLVSTVRKYKGTSNPIEKAVKDCISRGVLEDYLSRKGSEVINMLLAEYNYDDDIRVQRDESFTEGEIKGRLEGRIEGKAYEVYESVASNDYSIQRGMQKLGIATEEEFRKKAAVMGIIIP